MDRAGFLIGAGCAGSKGGMPADDTGTVATTQDAEATTTGKETQAKPDDYAELKAAIEKEREAAKKATNELKTTRARLAELESSKTDAEKLSAKIEALTIKARNANGKDAVRTAAKDAGAPDTDLIYRLVRSDIDFDDDDEPANVEDLIAGARKEFPDLFKTKPGKSDSGGEGARGKPDGKTTMNDWIRKEAGRA